MIHLMGIFLLLFLNTNRTNETNFEKFLNKPDANLNSMLIEASESPPEDPENC